LDIGALETRTIWAGLGDDLGAGEEGALFFRVGFLDVEEDFRDDLAELSFKDDCTIPFAAALALENRFVCLSFRGVRRSDKDRDRVRATPRFRSEGASREEWFGESVRLGFMLALAFAFDLVEEVSIEPWPLSSILLSFEMSDLVVAFVLRVLWLSSINIFPSASFCFVPADLRPPELNFRRDFFFVNSWLSENSGSFDKLRRRPFREAFCRSVSDLERWLSTPLLMDRPPDRGVGAILALLPLRGVASPRDRLVLRIL